MYLQQLFNPKTNLMRLLFIFLFSIAFTSCLGDLSGPEKLDIKKDFILEESDKFKLKVPKYFSSTDELNDDAELQFENTIRETYMIVMAESKADFNLARRILGEEVDTLNYAESYLDMQLESLEESLTQFTLGERKNTQVNDMPAVVQELTTRVDGYKIAFIMMAIEANHDVFYANAWTLGSRKERYFPTFYKSLHSIEQIDYDPESIKSVFSDEMIELLEQEEEE